MSDSVSQQEGWIVHRGHLCVPEGYDEDTVLSSLRKAGIPLVILENDADWDRVKSHSIPSLIGRPFPDDDNTVEATLWRGDTVSVVLTTSRKFRISPLRPVERLECWTADEILEAERGIRRLSRIFAAALHNPSYVKYVPNTPEHRVGIQSYIEVIPSGSPNDLESMDLLGKVQRFMYLFGHRNDLSYSQISDAQVKAIVDASKTLLFSPDSIEKQFPAPKRTIMKNHAAAARLVAETLLSQLHSAGGHVAHMGTPRRPDANQSETSGIIRIHNPQCAFCNSKVVENQLTLTGRHINILANYRPFTPDAHFMAVPIGHRSNEEQMSDDEILEEYSLLMRMGRVLEHVFNKSGYILWKQSAVPSGRTVQHEHTHLMVDIPELRSHWLCMSLLELAGVNLPFDSPEHMNEVAERYISIMKSIEADEPIGLLMPSAA